MVQGVVYGQQKPVGIQMERDIETAKEKIDIFPFDIVDRIIDGSCQVLETDVPS